MLHYVRFEHGSCAVNPWVGVTGRSIDCGEVSFIPRRLVGTSIDLHFRDYAKRVCEAGGVPMQVSASASPDSIVERLDGLLLSGGNDIEPHRYGQQPEPQLGSVDPERDEFEFALLDAFVKAGKPVFGICRGMQLINVYFGGTLIQDLGSDVPTHDGPHSEDSYRFHDVTIEPETLARSVYGSRLTVPSAHHQAVSDVGAGLFVGGRAADNTIEVLEAKTAPILAVQWHAEGLRDLDQGFAWLVEACHSRARS